MHKLLFLLLLVLPLGATGLVVVDADDSMPLAGATICGKGDIILGFTDIEGRADITGDSLTVRSLGYKTVKANATDTVRLHSEPITLAGMTVRPGDHPVTCLNTYIREYTSIANSTDTLQMFAEYMADIFLSEKKVKGFSPDSPTMMTRVRRQRVRHKNSEGMDTTYRPENGKEDLLSWYKLCSTDPKRHIVPEALSEDKPMITKGKYGPQTIIRLKDNHLTITNDGLSKHKDHHWSPWFLKAIGMTIDFTELIERHTYNTGTDRTYGPAKLRSSTYTMRMTLKGKFIKKAMKSKEAAEAYAVIEIYPMSATFLSAADAAEAKNDYTQKDIAPAPQAPALPPSIRALRDANVK